MLPDKNKSVKMKLTSNRTTFTDEIIKITKELPAITTSRMLPATM
jgi:hypothetical protein